MIALVEGAKRQKTPNEIALDILLAALTIVFLLACVTLLPFSLYSVKAAGQGTPITVTVLVALLVCLIPTTIGGLLSAIGIAGMDRMIQANVIATSGRAVEAAGDVDVLLLDKTGTITLGNRQAVEFRRPPASTLPKWPTRATSFAGGRNARKAGHRRAGQGTNTAFAAATSTPGADFIPFSAQTRISGVNGQPPLRKGAADAMEPVCAAGRIRRRQCKNGRRYRQARRYPPGGGRKP